MRSKPGRVAAFFNADNSSEPEHGRAILVDTVEQGVALKEGNLAAPKPGSSKLVIPQRSTRVLQVRGLKNTHPRPKSAPDTSQGGPSGQALQYGLQVFKKKMEKEPNERVFRAPLAMKSKVVISEEPTFEDYNAIPIEDFGKALLRGMGWDESMEEEVSLPQSSRPARLGLGAKPLVKETK